MEQKITPGFVINNIDKYKYNFESKDSINLTTHEFKIKQVADLENKIDNITKKMNDDNNKNIEKLSEISDDIKSELKLLKENNQLFDIILRKIIETFQLQDENLLQLSKTIELIECRNENLQRQIDKINENLIDIKNYIKLPWYKKIFL